MDTGQIMVFSIPAVIISLPGAILNILLLIVFLKDPLKCFRNSATYLVANLTTSDRATCSFFLLLQLVLHLFGQNTIFNCFMYWLVTTSCVSIASISIDRFLMVAYPIKHRILIKGIFMIVWLAAIWIVSFLPSVFFYYDDDDKIYGHMFLYTFNIIVVMVSAVMYSLTYYKFKKQSKNISLQNSSEGHAQEIRIKKEKRFLYTIVIISCIAFFSLVPTMAYFISFWILSLRTRLTFVLLIIALSIYYVNFAINPLIYILRLPNYRKTFSLLYCWRASWSGKSSTCLSNALYSVEHSSLRKLLSLWVCYTWLQMIRYMVSRYNSSPQKSSLIV